MNKNDLMLKAVIGLKGEMERDYSGLVCSIRNHPMYPDTVITYLVVDEGSFTESEDYCDSWKWLCTRDEFYQFIDDLLETCVKWDKPKWSDEGLPSVGVECEYFNRNRNEWEHAVIVAHHINGEEAIWSESIEGGSLYYGTANDFRPIKTEVERERAKLFYEARQKCMESGCFGSDYSYLDAIDTLINAGWKPTKTNEENK